MQLYLSDQTLVVIGMLLACLLGVVIAPFFGQQVENHLARLAERHRDKSDQDHSQSL